MTFFFQRDFDLNGKLMLMEMSFDGKIQKEIAHSLLINETQKNLILTW